MSRNKNRQPPNLALLPQVADIVARETTAEEVDPRPGRSRRAFSMEATSQVCFRIEKERHKKLKLYCVQNDLEIGEVLDNLIAKHLGI
jgi:hypothetical protein